MKVLIMTLRSDVGGGSKHVADLVGYMAKNNTVYIASPNDEPFYNVYKNFLTEHFLLSHRKFSFIKLIQLYFWIKKRDIKLIHSHGRGAGIYSRLLAILGVQVVHTFHGVHYDRSFKGKLNFLIDKLLLPFGTTYIFCSEDEKNYANQNGINPKNSSVICNGVDLEFFTKTQCRSKVQKLGTMARYDAIKGFDQLIKNSTKLNEIESFNFVVAGCDLKDLPKGSVIPPNLQFIGLISDVKGFYNSIDIFVSHSYREGLPLTVIEAMASGVPCLLSNVPGHQYFIKMGAAVGFDLNNFSSFQEGLEILKDIHKREEISDLAYQLIKNKHSIQFMCEQVNLVYEEIEIKNKNKQCEGENI